MTMRMPKQLAGRRRASSTIARGLGWFSIGLGVAEVLMPRRMARALGMEGHEACVLAYGLREIATGVGILISGNPSRWVWARVAGDAIDLATLGEGLSQSNRKAAVVGAIGAVAGVTFADIATARVLGELREKDATTFRDYSDRTGMPRPTKRVRAGTPDLDPNRSIPGLQA